MKLNVIDSGREFELFVVQYLYTVIINFQTKLKRKQEGYTSLLKKLRNVLFFSLIQEGKSSFFLSVGRNKAIKETDLDGIDITKRVTQKCDIAKLLMLPSYGK